MMPNESLLLVELKNSVPYWFEFIKLTVSILIGAALGYLGAFLQDRRNKKRSDEASRKQQLSKGYILLDSIIVDLVKFSLWMQKFTYNVLLNEEEEIDFDSFLNTPAVERLSELNLIITTFPEEYSTSGLKESGKKFRDKVQEQIDFLKNYSTKIKEIINAEIKPTIDEFHESTEYKNLMTAAEGFEHLKIELQKEIEQVILKMNSS